MIVSTGREVTKAPHFVVTPDRRARPLNVVGTQVTVLASNEATQSYGITLQQGDEGTGPPPHSHDWDEAFYVLSGEVQFSCDGEALVALPARWCTYPVEQCTVSSTARAAAKCWRSPERTPWPPRCLQRSINRYPQEHQTSRACCRFSGKTGSLSPLQLRSR